MKTILTTDKANKPFGYLQLDETGNYTASQSISASYAPIHLPYSSSNNNILPEICTGSMYIDVIHKLLYVYSGVYWMSSSMS
jgi:hypothetical protein